MILENNISIKIDIEEEYELLKELKSIDQRNELNFLKVLIMFEYDINYPSNKIEIIEITKYFIRKGYECIILPGH